MTFIHIHMYYNFYVDNKKRLINSTLCFHVRDYALSVHERNLEIQRKVINHLRKMVVSFHIISNIIFISFYHPE